MIEAFEDRKLVGVYGSSGIGRQTDANAVAAGGSGVAIGRRQNWLDENVIAVRAKSEAWCITADLTDRDQFARVLERPATEHADATVLANAAGVFVPQPFLDHDTGADNTYHDLGRTIFSLMPASTW
jgi:NADP-dependent 3-hydroxy acid dehydrogenase YdfG